MSVAEQWRDEAKARKARLWGRKVAPAPIVYIAPPKPAAVAVAAPPLVLRSALRISGIEYAEEASVRVFMDDVARAVCRAFVISKTELISSRRNAQIVTPRHVAFYLCRMMTPKSHPEIGRFLGNRDHTTSLNACSKAQQRVNNDPDFAAKVEAIKADILAAVARRDGIA